MELATARDLLGRHWGSFLAAVNDPEVRGQPGGVQSFVWQTLRNDYLSRGEPLPAGAFQAVNTLLGVAGSARRASLALARDITEVNRSGLDRSLVAEHLARDIDARDLGQMPLGPEWRIRFEVAFNVEGESLRQWITWDPGLNPPGTVQELLDSSEDVAQLLAGDYGVDYEGLTGGFSVTTI